MEVTILKGQKTASALNGEIYEIKAISITRLQYNGIEKQILFYPGSDLYKNTVLPGLTSKAELLKDGRINLL